MDVMIANAATCMKKVWDAEGTALSVGLKSSWKSRVLSFLKEVFPVGWDQAGTQSALFSEDRIDEIIRRHRPVLVDEFIEEVVELVDRFAGRSYDFGAASTEAAISSVSKAVVDEEIIQELMAITGSSRRNVIRTINRWFRNTQGKYFERFIIPETARLMSYMRSTLDPIDTIRAVGERYKKFAAADGYWDAISAFDNATAKRFAQVDVMYSRGVQYYVVSGIQDSKTCSVCTELQGTRFPVSDAVAQKDTMLVMEAEAAASQFPFPRAADIAEYTDLATSPYRLPPYHPNCRCEIIPAA